MTDSLTSKTLRGLNWSYLSTIVNAVLQIGFTAILARLLDPAAFGLIAMAGIILRFGSYFAQMGVGAALIQKGVLTDEDIRAAFTSSALLGVAFSGLTYMLAPLGLYIFDSPQVVPVIRATGFSFLLNGFSTTALSLLRRKLDFRSLAILEIVSYVIGYGGVGVVLAILGSGVWSLVFATLTQAGFSVILAYLRTRHRVSLMYRWRYLRGLYSYGGLLSTTSFLQSISSNLDTLAIGRFMGAYTLGIYNRASLLVALPSQYLYTSLSRVLFPAFSRIQSEVTKLRGLYLSGLGMLWALLMPITLGMIPAAKEIVQLVLGSKWLEAIPVFQILLTTIAFAAATNLAGIVMEALAKLKRMVVVEISYLCFLLLAFYLAVPFGLLGFSVAVAVATMFRGSIYLYLVTRVLGITFSHVLQIWLRNLLVSTMVFLGVLMVRNIMPADRTVTLFLLEIPTGITVYYIGFVLFLRSHLRIEAQMILNQLERAVELRPLSRRLLVFFRKTTGLAQKADAS